MQAKDIGEQTELLFSYEAFNKGLSVSKPQTIKRYDFIVDARKRLFRVQVKTCSYKQGNNYKVRLKTSKKYEYKEDDFDILAVYVKPLKLWIFIDWQKRFPDKDKQIKDTLCLKRAELDQPNNWEIFFNSDST